ncbi:MAG: carbohydrate ABC transporter substrate-binding protein [Lachnospiraceae bacterium]|nr:carbohydrate ABC transporter substrate-binding protein [Lachnospiraceae bacterium]MBO6299508.1 carbohydrate ABC transporter substrate-binding protein [Lachnospiraceae bacterium]
MKKRLMALSMAAIMAMGSLAGCGGTTPAAPAAGSGETPAATEAPAAGGSETPAATEAPAEGGDATVAAGEEGSVLNIYVWNEEFKSRLEDHYPGYEKVDATTGKIGDVTVKFTITPSDDNAYQNKLDSTLPGNASAAADDKVDIFLVEADYALKYVDESIDVAMKLSDLGITDADLADQYEYTKDVVTDASGNLRGASWQACSAGLIYNREAAKDVLGTDDPAEVQKAVSDWSKYVETAKAAQAKGYTMCSVNDTYRTYSNNVSGKWVQDGKIVVDKNLEAWVDDSKALVDAKAENTFDLWGDDWAKAKDPAGKTFCYFGPAWFFNFCLDADREGSIAHDGGWGFCEGPQGYFWGGTWICAATGTDNQTLVKDVILTMTTDQAVLKDIAVKDSDCVNSKAVLAELAASDDGNIALLGGQNPYAQLAAGAEKIDLSNLSEYDQGCTEEFQHAMKNYFDGNATKEEAYDLFYKAVEEKYPELSH